MRVSISGSTGFLARNLAEYFSSNQVQLIKRDEDPYGSLNIFKPDVIIHCAAEIYDSDLMFDSNVILTKNYLDWLKDNPNVRMIHIGSSSEYGPVDQPTNEDDKINPIDMYQATKGISTLLCQGYARTYDLNIQIIRPYSVYGKYEKPHRLFPKLWKSFVKNENMTLHDGYHDFIYIKDFMRGLELILNSDAPKGDIINLGSGQQYSNFDVLHAFNKITGNTAPVTEVHVKAKKFMLFLFFAESDHSSQVDASDRR
jgi:nucleoside-diphosphate-sugar epimerase